MVGERFGNVPTLLAARWHAMSLAWGPFHVTSGHAFALPQGLFRGRCAGLEAVVRDSRACVGLTPRSFVGVICETRRHGLAFDCGLFQG